MTYKKKRVVWIAILLTAASLVWAHGWKAPEAEASRENPLESTPENLEAGKKLFWDFCSGCHGENARGGDKSGTDPSSPPDLLERLKGHSQGDFFWKIQTGRNGMPSFKEDLNDKETWQIVLFLNEQLNRLLR